MIETAARIVFGFIEDTDNQENKQTDHQNSEESDHAEHQFLSLVVLIASGETKLFHTADLLSCAGGSNINIGFGLLLHNGCSRFIIAVKENLDAADLEDVAVLKRLRNDGHVINACTIG